MIPQNKMLNLVENFSKETDRLMIKRFSSENIETEVTHDTHPVIMRFVRDILPDEDALKRAKSIAEPWKAEQGEWAGLAIYEKQALSENPSADMIGMLSFYISSMENETLEIGYRLHPDYQGKGYATEACRMLIRFLFEHCKAHRITAYCVKENVASWKVMQKIGMQREACFREFSKLAGQWCDELVYAILASDFDALNKP